MAVSLTVKIFSRATESIYFKCANLPVSIIMNTQIVSGEVALFSIYGMTNLRGFVILINVVFN